jgi:hypothetical protein
LLKLKMISLVGASVAEWLRSLTSNHFPLTVVGSSHYRHL